MSLTRERLSEAAGDIDFDMINRTLGRITAQLSRPAGVVLAQGLFRPRALSSGLVRGNRKIAGERALRQTRHQPDG